MQGTNVTNNQRKHIQNTAQALTSPSQKNTQKEVVLETLTQKTVKKTPTSVPDTSDENAIELTIAMSHMMVCGFVTIMRTHAMCACR